MFSKGFKSAAAALMAGGLLLAVPTATQAKSAKTETVKTDPATLKAKGEPRNCITANGINTKQVNENTILFQQGANRWYRNDLPNSCNGLKFDRTLVFKNMIGGQYCAMDLFEVVDAGSRMPYGTCSLGKFTPVEVPKGTKF